MRPSAVRAAIPDIDVVEAHREPQPFTDIYFVAVPMPTYKALSDHAAKKNMTVAQLLRQAFTRALEE